jgi:hypothetical protein
MDPSVEGKFDHRAVDVKGGRLFLTAPKHHSIEVFDLKSVRGLLQQVMAVVDSQNGKVLQTVPIGEDCDATAFDPGTGTAFTSNNDGTLTSVRAGSNGSYSAVQTLTLGDGSKTTGLDLSTHKLYFPAAKFSGPPSARAAHGRYGIDGCVRCQRVKITLHGITRTTIPSPGDRR